MTWQLSTRYLPFQKSKTENWLESLGWETTIRTKDPKDCCSTLKVDSAKTWFWTTSKLSDLPELQIYIIPELSTRSKKRKWMWENKKAANQQRLRPKDHSTPKSNAGSTTVENGCPLQKVEEIETGKTGLNRWLQAMTMLTSNRWVPVVPFSCCTVPSTSALKVSQLFIPRLSQQAHRINITTEMNKMRDICFTCNRNEDPDSLVSVCKKVLDLLPPPLNVPCSPTMKSKSSRNLMKTFTSATTSKPTKKTTSKTQHAPRVTNLTNNLTSYRSK